MVRLALRLMLIRHIPETAMVSKKITNTRAYRVTRIANYGTVGRTTGRATDPLPVVVTGAADHTRWCLLDRPADPGHTGGRSTATANESKPKQADLNKA